MKPKSTTDKTSTAPRTHATNGALKDNDQEIYDKIYRAIIEQRLLAGTKLGEEALSKTFNVSRTRIRRILLVLSNHNVVELRPNIGAFVATPEPRETRHVFEARRTIEGTIVERVVKRITREQTKVLRGMIEEETKHLRAGNRHGAIRLSGQFHLTLAEFSENFILHDFLRELVSRTSLIIGMFGTSNNTVCSEEDHQLLLDAIISGDASSARKIMNEHLHRIEDSITLPQEKSEAVDFAKIFAGP
ncbi:GntR family transcriptional regulator [bacterium]|jgi:DNA-binding GntR family transcriptional regulator|nr:GntR family transcriptional regulator [bacterium]MEE4314208.1 GntR family transcriptional regulator [Desulfofustis sp.]